MQGTELAPAAGLPLRRIDLAAYAGLALAATGAVASAALNVYPLPVLVAIAAVLAFTALHRWLLAWRTMLGGIVLVILVIPIKRYELPVSLPLQLEPYRLLVGGVGAALAGSLLIDQRLKLRATGLDGPLVMLGAAILLSVISRVGHIMGEGLTGYVIRNAMFFASYIIVFYLVTLAITRRSEVEWLLRLLVGGAAVVAAFTIYESRSGYNIFDHIPLLQFNGIPYVTDRGGGARAYASAQHPIAMGAALMMLVPLGIYLVHSTQQRRWWLATALLLMGALATKSRTGIIMMVVILVAMLILKPRATRRMLPKLLPLLLVVHVAMPGTLSTFKNTFFPSGGVVAAETSTDAQWRVNYGRGRIGEWDPALKEWAHTPLFGQGIGTRVNDLRDVKFNAPITDDQWLASLLELGVVGIVALLWFFTTAIRRLGRLARRDDSNDGWLRTGLAAALASYAFGMLTFDAFNFVQVTMLMFLIAALSVAVLRAEERPA
jgi:O-antigen ligase/polysaccharide polymerase Wzy-like membrane protein